MTVGREEGRKSRGGQERGRGRDIRGRAGRRERGRGREGEREKGRMGEREKKKKLRPESNS